MQVEVVRPESHPAADGRRALDVDHRKFVAPCSVCSTKALCSRPLQDTVEPPA